MRNIIVIPKRKGPVKDPLPLDNGRFPHENYMRVVAKGRRAERRFSSPALSLQQAREAYNVVQETNSLNEPTLAFKGKRKFI